MNITILVRNELKENALSKNSRSNYKRTLSLYFNCTTLQYFRKVYIRILYKRKINNH